MMNNEYLEKHGLRPWNGGVFSRLRADSTQSLPELVKMIQSFISIAMTNKAKAQIAIVTYDITDDKVRKHVSDYLIAKGCIRIQKSVFVGLLPKKTWNKIALDLFEVNRLYENDDTILIIPQERSQFSETEMIGLDLQLGHFTRPKQCLVI